MRAAKAVDLDADLPTGPQVLGYNDFWFETQGLGANVRTSHIVYPINGQSHLPLKAQRSSAATR